MDKKLSTGLAVRVGKQPYGFLGKEAAGASAKAGHTGRRFGRLAQEIRAGEVISNVVERPTAPSSRSVTLSIFRCAVKLPLKIIFLLRFVGMFSYRNLLSCH